MPNGLPYDQDIAKYQQAITIDTAMSLDLHQLKTFCVVAEEENIARASVRLYLSAPAVSGHIKALEDELGVALFSRGPRGMRLTEAGHTLWEDAEALLKQAAAMRRKASSLSDEPSGILRIGINNPPDSLHVPELIANLGARFPSLRFESVFGSSQYVINGLRQDEFDIGFTEWEKLPTEIESIPLEARQIRLIAPLEWAEQLRDLPPAELAPYPWLFASEGCSHYIFARNWCEAHKLHIEPRIRSDDIDQTTVGFVARGLGLSLVAMQSLEASAYREEVAVLPQIEGSVPLSIAYLKERRDDALVSTAVRFVRELFSVEASQRTTAKVDKS